MVLSLKHNRLPLAGNLLLANLFLSCLLIHSFLKGAEVDN